MNISVSAIARFEEIEIAGQGAQGLGQRKDMLRQAQQSSQKIKVRRRKTGVGSYKPTDHPASRIFQNNMDYGVEQRVQGKEWESGRIMSNEDFYLSQTIFILYFGKFSSLVTIVNFSTIHCEMIILSNGSL